MKTHSGMIRIGMRFIIRKHHVNEYRAGSEWNWKRVPEMKLNPILCKHRHQGPASFSRLFSLVHMVQLKTFDRERLSSIEYY